MVWGDADHEIIVEVKGNIRILLCASI